MTADGQNGVSPYERLAEVLGEHGTVTIEREWHPSALPWSCNIYVDPSGYGTGNSMEEAIEDALLDWERAR